MLRALLLIVLASCQLPACTCFDAPWKRQFSEATFIFRGVAKSIERLPERPGMTRARYKVSFTVLESWKGSPKEPISVYYMAPGTDCQGDKFSEGAEYLMFVVETPVRDYRTNHSTTVGRTFSPKGRRC
jgi:hypothetical protein